MKLNVHSFYECRYIDVVFIERCFPTLLKETIFQAEETDPCFINHVSFVDLISALRNTSLPVKSKASKF